MLTRGDKTNRTYTENSYHVTAQKIDPLTEKLLFDPQTSGGILMSVSPEVSTKVLRDLKAHGDESSTLIGRVLDANRSP